MNSQCAELHRVMKKNPLLSFEGDIMMKHINNAILRTVTVVTITIVTNYK